MDVEKANAGGTGFPALARRIARNPNYESFIFRKFDRLSARNLLHLEAKLAYLEYKLDRVDEQAALPSANTENLRSLRSWEAFEENATKDGGLEHTRMKLADQIQETLKQYQEALLRQNQIAALEPPRDRAFDVVNNLSHNNVKDQFGQTKQPALLAGLSKDRLKGPNRYDLAAVRQPANKDLLSRWLQDHWIFKSTKITDETEHIDEGHITWVAASISTLVAAILLVVSVVVLRVVSDKNAQLGAIAGFMALFATSVVVLTNARRAEIFASTAAYAAVLVVFVSTNSGDCQCTTTTPGS